MRLTEDRLVAMALGALEEGAATCRYRPVQRSAALRLVLAYLASRQPCDRGFFDSFWRGVDTVRPRDRAAILHASLNGIYRQVGRKREAAVEAAYDKPAREAHPEPSESNT